LGAFEKADSLSRLQTPHVPWGSFLGIFAEGGTWVIKTQKKKRNPSKALPIAAFESLETLAKKKGKALPMRKGRVHGLCTFVVKSHGFEGPGKQVFNARVAALRRFRLTRPGPEST